MANTWRQVCADAAAAGILLPNWFALLSEWLLVLGAMREHGMLLRTQGDGCYFWVIKGYGNLLLCICCCSVYVVCGLVTAGAAGRSAHAVQLQGRFSMDVLCILDRALHT